MLRAYRQLAYNNLLANSRILTAAEQLAPGEFAATRTGFFPSIVATLNHVITVDWYYIDAFAGGDLGAKAWENPEPFGEAKALKMAQLQSDQKLVAFCEQIEPKELAEPLKLLRYEEPLGNVLMHLFQHQIHHRGQAHAMFSGTSVAPPQLDEFMFGVDHQERIADLAALKLAEADLPNY